MTVAMALLVVLLAPGSASAITQFFTFTVTIDSSCVSGTGPNNTSITLTLKNSDGVFKATGHATSNGTGSWSADNCFAASVASGDTLRASGGGHTRIFTIPVLTLDVNRTTDVVSGKAPKNSSVLLNLLSCPTYNGCSGQPAQAPATTAQGSYSVDYTATYNVKGSDYSYVGWTSPSGDHVYTNGYAPYVNVVLRHNTFNGYAGRTQLVTINLESESGTALASGHGIGAAGYGGYSGEVRNGNRAPVYFNPGRKVHASFGTGSFTIPALTISSNTGTDTLLGTCLPNHAVQGYAYDPTQPYRLQSYSYANGNTNGAGHYSLDMSNSSYPTFDLSSGDVIRITCKMGTGDSVELDSTAP